MRQNKFRGKSVETGEWVYGYYVNTHERPRIIYEDNEGFYCEDEVDPETVGQFIVIHGKEFHEGDKIKYQYYRDYGQSGEYEEREAVVKWNDKQAGFEPFCYWNTYNYEMNKVEVIGTIHDGEVKA